MYRPYRRRCVILMIMVRLCAWGGGAAAPTAYGAFPAHASIRQDSPHPADTPVGDPAGDNQVTLAANLAVSLIGSVKPTSLLPATLRGAVADDDIELTALRDPATAQRFRASAAASTESAPAHVPLRI